MDNGFIKLHRKITEWEWYSDTNVVRLFIHLILTCNYKEKKWRGTLIKRGQMLTGLHSLSEQTGLSVKKIRVALDKLKQTGEVAIKTTNKFSIITVCKYDSYQINGTGEGQANWQSKGQSGGKQRATTKEREEIEEEKNILDIGANFQNLLIPEMQKIFCESNSGYIPDKQMDFLPLMTIAKFVLKKFFPGESDVVKNKDAILEKWRGICGWISQNNFYKTKPLKTIANQIQEILQSPENGTNKSSNSNGTPKSRRDKHYDSMHELLRMGQEEFDKLRGASTGS